MDGDRDGQWRGRHHMRDRCRMGWVHRTAVVWARRGRATLGRHSGPGRCARTPCSLPCRDELCDRRRSDPAVGSCVTAPPGARGASLSASRRAGESSQSVGDHACDSFGVRRRARTTRRDLPHLDPRRSRLQLAVGRQCSRSAVFTVGSVHGLQCSRPAVFTTGGRATARVSPTTVTSRTVAPSGHARRGVRVPAR